MRIVPLGVLFPFVLIAGNSYGQSWKEYDESAKLFLDRKNTAKALEFYLKANSELKKDSAGTVTLANNSNNIGRLYFSLGQDNDIERFLLKPAK